MESIPASTRSTNSDDRTVRVGLIGYGYAGKTFHVPLLQSVPGLSLVVVGSTRPELVQAELPGVIVCSADEVPAHPEVDLVVIATPNESHFRLASAALRSGKGVVVDKPFTVTLAEARSLAEIAKHHHGLLSVFHNRRWDSEILATKAVCNQAFLARSPITSATWIAFAPSYASAGAKIAVPELDYGLTSART